jgi:hypothetical protein
MSLISSLEIVGVKLFTLRVSRNFSNLEKFFDDLFLKKKESNLFIRDRICKPLRSSF